MSSSFESLGPQAACPCALFIETLKPEKQMFTLPAASSLGHGEAQGCLDCIQKGRCEAKAEPEAAEPWRLVLGTLTGCAGEEIERRGA